MRQSHTQMEHAMERVQTKSDTYHFFNGQMVQVFPHQNRPRLNIEIDTLIQRAI